MLEYRQATRNEQRATPITPLALYIHWPFCKSKCPYCDFNSHVRDRVDQARWRENLLRELDHMAASLPGRRVSSIFFGGGTPSLMPPETAQALITRAKSHWPGDESIEITLEANPTSVETGTFEDFKEAGINRVSLGIQSLRESELRFLGREHSADEACRAIERARATFERFSFDLIYARPGQTTESWREELSEALALAGNHLSLYQLTIEENTAFAHAYAKGGFTLPDEAESEALYRLTEAMMEARGLPAYEVSNYAAPGEESRHNLTYWQGGEYAGIGPGAHGRLHIDGMRIAGQTIKSPERWLEAVERQGNGLEVWQHVPGQQEIEERLMMGLRLTSGIDYAQFTAQTRRDLRDHLDPRKLAFYRDQSLLCNDESCLRATLKGRLVLNRLTAELLR